MPLILGSNRISGSGAYSIANSLRFNSASSDYLSRTPSTTTDRQKWTISFWLKRSRAAANTPIISQGSTSGAKAIINFGSGDRLAITFDNAASGDFRAAMLFRDQSAWYHIVVACDTTQATASNRVKTYVNGVQQTYSTEVQPSQNYNTQFNTNTILRIGTESDAASTYLNGYLSDFYLIDGQQLTPLEFGETDTTTGIWKPKAYTGSFGTNGFLLPKIKTTGGFSSFEAQIDGLNQRLAANSVGTLFNMGTGDFTVETFVKMDSLSIFDMITFYTGSTPKNYFYYYFGEVAFFDATWGYVNGGAPSPPIKSGAWYHIAWVRNGNTMTIYINGVSLISQSVTGLNITGIDNVRFCQSAGRNNASGVYSNVRIVKGTAVYTANFTPPSSPLTNVSGTSLLTLQSSTIIDNSSNSLSITNTGSVVMTSSSTVNSSITFFDDNSGNNNNFTESALTSQDYTTDTPTNNFATINPLTCNDTATLTLTDGNLTLTGGNDMGATFGLTQGKWYWESKRSNTGTVAHWGILFDDSFFSSTQLVSGTQSSGYFFRNDFSGGLYVQNSGANGFTSISSSSSGSSVADGDIIGFALDLDSATKSVTFYQNGSQIATASFSYDKTLSTCFPYARNNSGAQSQWNFGNPPFNIASANADANGYGKFEYAPPSGYYAICTKNLAEYG